MPFDAAIDRTIASFKEQGFGVLSDIDIQAAMKTKLGVDFRPYRILGMCNPPLAHRALLAEDRIGVMLPCSVIVQEKGGSVEVAAVNPLVAMAAVDNPALGEVASEVTALIAQAVDAI